MSFIQIEDTVTDELLDPPRPWKFSPLTLAVRNGFATEYWATPDIEEHRIGGHNEPIACCNTCSHFSSFGQLGTRIVPRELPSW